MTVTFTVTGLERIKGCGRVLALAALEIDFDGVVVRLEGFQVLRQGHRVFAHAPRFRNPKTGVWAPAVVLPDELSSAIAQELQRLLACEAGRDVSGAALSEVLSTPLDQLIEDTLADI